MQAEGAVRDRGGIGLARRRGGVADQEAVAKAAVPQEVEKVLCAVEIEAELAQRGGGVRGQMLQGHGGKMGFGEIVQPVPLRVGAKVEERDGMAHGFQFSCRSRAGDFAVISPMISRIRTA